MGKARKRSMQTVIPFPEKALRPLRPPPRADERPGEILLFTGIRYERQPEPGPDPSTPRLSDGQSRSGRRRRRS